MKFINFDLTRTATGQALHLNLIPRNMDKAENVEKSLPCVRGGGLRSNSEGL